MPLVGRRGVGGGQSCVRARAYEGCCVRRLLGLFGSLGLFEFFAGVAPLRRSGLIAGVGTPRNVFYLGKGEPFGKSRIGVVVDTGDGSKWVRGPRNRTGFRSCGGPGAGLTPGCDVGADLASRRWTAWAATGPGVLRDGPDAR